jgi:hypothetical protein
MNHAQVHNHPHYCHATKTTMADASKLPSDARDTLWRDNFKILV